METPPSDSCIGKSRSDLIRDIGRGGAAGSGLETLEHRLMHVAGDPLAVRAILSEIESCRPRSREAAPITGDTVIALGGMLAHGMEDRGDWPQGFMRYDCREMGVDNALHPSVFAPTLEDRELALDFDAPIMQPATTRFSSWRHIIAVASVFLAALVWFVVLQAWG